MTNAKMHPIEVQDTPMLLQSALAPGGELLLQIAVEPTDGARTGRHSQQSFSHVSDFVGACPSHEHLGQSLSHLRFIAAVALENLRVELALAISRNLQVLNPTPGGNQVAVVRALTIAFAPWAALTPTDSHQRVQFLAHHFLQH